MHCRKKHSQLFISLLITGFLVLPATLWAEFYRYIGEDGAIHFTDDLSQVPMDQREKMEAYEGVEAPQPPALETPGSDAATEAAQQAKEAVTNLKEKRQALVTRQEALQAEYQRLMDAKAEIDALRQSADTPEKQRALQEKAVALQAEITQYEARSKALNDEVNAFNAVVKAGAPAQPE
jgi:predicted RNase H-like nuclease (RuvC/YqgF family)